MCGLVTCVLVCVWFGNRGVGVCVCEFVNFVLVCVRCNWCVGVCAWVGKLCVGVWVRGLVTGVLVCVWVGKLFVGVCGL